MLAVGFAVLLTQALHPSRGHADTPGPVSGRLVSGSTCPTPSTMMRHGRQYTCEPDPASNPPRPNGLQWGDGGVPPQPYTPPSQPSTAP